MLLDDRIGKPQTLRKQMLQSLHSAHQGCTGMKARVNQCSVSQAQLFHLIVGIQLMINNASLSISIKTP